MALKQGMQSGADVLPKYNWDLGMNDEMLEHDRAGFTTSMEMLTGGVAHEWDCFGGLEVGNQYDMDPMGEERSETTFNSGEYGPQPKGHVGMAGPAQSAGGMEGGAVVRTVGGGKSMQTAPQTYSKYPKRA